jgi:hypothetical protein
MTAAHHIQCDVRNLEFNSSDEVKGLCFLLVLTLFVTILEWRDSIEKGRSIHWKVQSNKANSISRQLMLICPTEGRSATHRNKGVRANWAKGHVGKGRACTSFARVITDKYVSLHSLNHNSY